MGQQGSKHETGIRVANSIFNDHSLPLEPKRSASIQQTSFFYRGNSFPIGSGVVIKTRSQGESLAILLSLPTQAKHQDQAVESDDEPIFKKFHAEKPAHKKHDEEVLVQWLVRATEIPESLRKSLDPRPAASDVFLYTSSPEYVNVRAIQSVFSWKPFTMHVPQVTNFRSDHT
jgi:hypothetical protein